MPGQSNAEKERLTLAALSFGGWVKAYSADSRIRRMVKLKNNYRINDDQTVSLFIKRRKGKALNVVIDLDEFAKVASVGRWRVTEGRGGIMYACATAHRGTTEERTILLQRLIMGETDTKSQAVTFKDGNTFNCRKSNLMVAHRSMIAHQLRRGRLKSRTGQRNIYARYEGSYQVQITIKGRQFVKTFYDLQKAADYRDFILRSGGLDVGQKGERWIRT